MVSQLIDVTIFHFLKKNGTTNDLAAGTGSTVISQLFDSFIVLGIAFWMTGKMTTKFYSICIYRLFCKAYHRHRLTPLIYLGHSIIEKYLHNE
jgi:uncharacterized integral membrane protein (TIGR00697 family)